MYFLHVTHTKHLKILCILNVHVDLEIFYSWWEVVVVTTVPEVGYEDLFFIRPRKNETFISVGLIGKQYMYQTIVLTLYSREFQILKILVY